jgi:hypothetical protein
MNNPIHSSFKQFINELWSEQVLRLRYLMTENATH